MAGYKINFKTQIDNYKGGKFPDNFVMVPNKGDLIEVLPIQKQFFRNKSLPTRLEVVSIIHKYDERNFVQEVEVELHYNKQDAEIAIANKVNLY